MLLLLSIDDLAGQVHHQVVVMRRDNHLLRPDLDQLPAVVHQVLLGVPRLGEDQPPFPTTLFVVDRVVGEATYVSTAAIMSLMSLPILVSCTAALSRTGILGRSWHPLWEPESPRLALSELGTYSWDSLYHRMRSRPVDGGMGAASCGCRCDFRGLPTLHHAPITLFQL